MNYHFNEFFNLLIKNKFLIYLYFILVVDEMIRISNNQMTMKTFITKKKKKLIF